MHEQKIPLVDLKAQYHDIKEEVDAAIEGVLEGGHFILGPEVRAFETEFAAYCQSSFAVGVNSGSSALHLALLAAGVGEGDEVITTAFTFVATVAAIEYTGARPVLVDVDPLTLTIDPDRLQAAITPRTKALLPVHLYGQMAEMEAIMDIASRSGLVVIEDAAQAHGAERFGRRAGAIGDIGCFSFYPGKNLGAFGDGGAITSSNEEFARAVRMLRDWGAEQKYVHTAKGFNFRLDELQAAILRVKLRRLERWTEFRRAHARTYGRLLADAPVGLPYEDPAGRHVFHIYAIRTLERDRVLSELHAAGVHAGIHYPIPVHLQPAYANLGYHQGDFPVAERAADQVLSLPLYPEISPAALERVAETLIASTRVGRGEIVAVGA